jgi:soluble lytic murein transglycosylase-like protein
MDKIFQSQFDSVMYTMMSKVMERMMEKLEKYEELSESTGDTANTGSSTSSGTASAAYSSAGYSGTSFSSLIEQAADKYGVNPNLVSAVIKAESNFNSGAVSSAGALGLMQLMPGTATSLGVSDALDPVQNIDGGTKFLRKLLDHYDGNITKAVAAYNAGPGAVDSYGGVPPYSETQTYVQRVLNYFNSYSSSEWEA